MQHMTRHDTTHTQHDTHPPFGCCAANASSFAYDDGDDDDDGDDELPPLESLDP
jgi:hypothetical protein